MGAFCTRQTWWNSSKNLLLWNRWSDFELISQDIPWVTLFKNCSWNFDMSINMALVNGGYLHCRDMKKILVNSSLKVTKRKIGSSHLKNSGERSRAILALLSGNYASFWQPHGVFCSNEWSDCREHGEQRT